MVSPRARWLAARTRNAARHGLLIAGSGVIVMIAALLTFVLVPRQVDRALGVALSLMPAPRDTLALRAARALAADSLAAVTARRTTALTAVGTATTDSLLPPAVAALRQQLARARQTPLVESYRTLAEASLLARNDRTRATVSVLLDSIEQLNREREAYAALSGPDARYAAITARLTRLGDRLVRVAEQALAARQSSVSASSATSPAVATLRAPGDSSAVAPADSAASPLFPQAPMPDSLLDAAVREAEATLAQADSALGSGRLFNDSLSARKEALRARMQLSIPPVAMLLASLVLGLVAGFSVALWRELRRPTVGDAQELETLTHSRVIVHPRDEGVLPGRRPRRGEAAVPALTPAADAWPLLHLTLSNIGDMARHVQVVADQPVLAGAVGLNLASVAARESRATALVDAAQRAGAIVPLLPASVIGTSGAREGRREQHGSDDGDWDFSREVPLGRDASVALVLPRRARSYRHRPVRNAGAATAVATAEDETHLALEAKLRQFDFVVFVTDDSSAPALPPDSDLVLCARLGVTPLAWLARAVRQADDRGRRIRAVVLWESDVPLAG